LATLETDEAEKRYSFGLYERWRRRLDRHLYAGGAIERSNTMEFLDASRGFAPTEELAAAEHEEACAGKERTLVAEELEEARTRAYEFRMGIRKAEDERADLWRRIASQQREYDRWWHRHLEQLPAYCQELQGVRQAEAAVAEMRGGAQHVRLECEDIASREAAAAIDLREARDEFEKREWGARRVQHLEEQAMLQKEKLASQAAWQPDEIQRFQEVHRSSHELRRAQQFHKMCTLESEEARKTEARCALEKQGLDYSLKRAKEELSDVKKHIELLKTQYKRSSSLLAQREEARQELLRIHSDVALEHERRKLALASMNISFEDVGELSVQKAKSVSPRSSQGMSAISVPVSSREAQATLPARFPGRRRAL